MTSFNIAAFDVRHPIKMCGKNPKVSKTTQDRLRMAVHSSVGSLRVLKVYTQTKIQSVPTFTHVEDHACRNFIR